MFCPNCGFQVGNSQFCPNCGSKTANIAKAVTVSLKNQWLALGLCICFGWLGVHRYYVGKIGTGLLYMCSYGGFLFGWFTDAYHIANGTFTDKDGLPLKKRNVQQPVFIKQTKLTKLRFAPVVSAMEQEKGAADTDNTISNVFHDLGKKLSQVIGAVNPDDAIFGQASSAQPIPTPPTADNPQVKVDPETPIGKCIQAVSDYLQKNKSTPFFREKLNATTTKLALFAKRSSAVQEIIVERFGTAGLTYSKFTAPVVALEKHTIEMVDHLVSKMQLFDEEDCKRRIQEMLEKDRYKEMQEYIALEANYKEFAEKTLATLDDALLKLDKLIYEMSKLNETGLDQATQILDGIDELIKDTPHYS